MAGRNQLKQEAAQLRGDIDRRACLAHQSIDKLRSRASRLALSPAALPIAFVSGILAERWGMPAIKNAHALLTSLAGQGKAEDLISGLMGSSLR